MIFKFIKGLTYTIFLYIIIFFISGYFLEFIINRNLKDKLYNAQLDWHLFKGLNCDVLFIGNSRTKTHFNVNQYNAEFNHNAYIIGQMGQKPRLLYYKFCEYLKVNPTPEKIYLQFDPVFWQEREDLYGYENYAPYFFHERLGFTEKLKGLQGYHSLYKKIPLLAFKRESKSRLIFWKILFGQTLRSEISSARGFQFPKDEIIKFGGTTNEPESIGVRSPYIDSFFKLCCKKDIKLNALFTPITNQGYRHFYDIGLIKKDYIHLKKKYQTEGVYLDFSQTITNKAFFRNHTHLNKQGVDSFMTIFLKAL